MFDKMKQLYEMQKQAKELQKALERIQVQKESRDGALQVTVNGAMRVEGVRIDSAYLSPDRKNDLEKSLRDLINEGFTDVQKQSAAQAAQLMKGMPGLNLPGL